MFSYVISSATSYFHLPIEEEDDDDDDGLPFYPKNISWQPISASSSSMSSPSHSRSSSSSSSSASSSTNPGPDRRAATMNEVLAKNDLYDILGISRKATLDKNTLRRAYLSRSKACHPDKFPNNPKATHAFQKVSVAYDVLSTPSSKRMYDTRTRRSAAYDYWSPQGQHNAAHADDTFRAVIIGVFNDFLDGDVEMIRTLLRSVNDINPSLKIGEDSVDSVLATLRAVRERALTCRTCVIALHTDLSTLLELQHTFRQMSYFDLRGRFRVSIQLTRITLGLPVTLERALKGQGAVGEMRNDSGGKEGRTRRGSNVLLPRPMYALIKGIDGVLGRMERIM
ncbi:DnaJ-domain-containing protein [Athelia psychrophila]|uniref:DnaJ-domain-containing protein n=1 Tax=Athelia psychrophila TaxID=1759441 RepID=A0A166QML3_9AGAM|nr:DnaJ-domain-containing protein [Fibularhizoctonia sp. CBS 109695]